MGRGSPSLRTTQGRLITTLKRPPALILLARTRIGMNVQVDSEHGGPESLEAF